MLENVIIKFNVIGLINNKVVEKDFYITYYSKKTIIIKNNEILSGFERYFLEKDFLMVFGINKSLFSSNKIIFRLKILTISGTRNNFMLIIEKEKVIML